MGALSTTTNTGNHKGCPFMRMTDQTGTAPVRAGSFHYGQTELAPTSLSGMSGRAAFLLSAAAMLLLPAILNRPITVFLMVERTWGADPERTWHLSSSKVTSLTQCSLFSMPQCSLDSFSSLRAVALCGRDSSPHTMCLCSSQSL